MPGLWQRLRRDEAGAALVEATLVFPVLMVLGFGVFEFSFSFFRHHIITTGVHDAARYIARRNDPDSAAAQTAAQNIAATGTVDGTGARRLSWWAPADVTVPALTTVANPRDEVTGERQYRGGDVISIVTVTTTVTFPDLGFLDFLGLDPLTMTIAHSERVIGE